MNENKNPYAHQKITSKKLFVESNLIKKEEVDDKGIKAMGIFFSILIVVGVITAYFYWIYPSFIKQTYTIEDACNNPYECEDNADGSRTCSYYDEKDNLVKVTCNGTTTTSSTKASKTTMIEQ